ncbi:MAG: AMP-dependent synthetase/ligase [bacterium]|nr:AMP-dependent synthetase/ligase [bacterium]
MTDASRPLLVDRKDLTSTIAMVQERAASAPAHVAFRVPEGDGFREVTLPGFLAEVDAAARGLVGLGFGAGDAAAVMAATSYEWAVAEFAIWRAGGVVVPIYDTSPAERTSQILADSGARLAFADSGALPRLRADELDLGAWLLDGQGAGSIGELGASPTSPELEAELDARTRSVRRGDPATLVYTSGTTGEQKGVRITHGNFVDLVLNVAAAWEDVINDRGSTVIFLPLAHVLARGLQLVCMHAGMTISHLAEPTQVVATLPRVQPTFLVVVPRVLEKILSVARQRAREKRMGRVWQAAEETAIAWGTLAEREDRGVPARRPVGLRVRHALFERLFYRRIRAMLGGRLEFLLSGAARLDSKISLFFRGAGIPVMEGYGLTETTAPATGNRPGRIRSGTVGEPVPGTTIRISPSGEVLVRGIGVAAGYTDPALTGQAWSEGFLHTGDLGSLDDDGHLTITGRVKEVLVTAGGKTVSPAPWESLVESDPLVAHAVMVGEGRPYLGALLVLDRSELANWAEREGVELGELVTSSSPIAIENPALLERLGQVVASANETVARSEGVRRVRALLAELSEEAGTLTPTLKVRRDALLAKLTSFVDDIYERKNA